MEPTNPQNVNGGFRLSQEGLHPPYSFSVFADREAITDELNPLTISHTAKTISCTAIGTARTTWEVDIGPMTRNITNMLVTIINMIPIRPQPDNHRGTSFV